METDRHGKGDKHSGSGMEKGNEREKNLKVNCILILKIEAMFGKVSQTRANTPSLPRPVSISFY